MALYRDKRYVDAVAVDEDAVAIRRELYRMKPSATREKFAALLHGFAIHLYSVKRYEDACTVNAEAVALRRLLCELDEKKYKEYLTSSLETYGVRLGSVQRFEEAVIAEQEAVSYRRQLLEAKQSDTRRRSLIEALENYSTALNDLGRVKEARVILEEMKRLKGEGKKSGDGDSSENSSDEENAA